MLPARGALVLFLLVLGAAYLHANQSDDIIFDLNDEELMEASLPETAVHKDNGIMGRLRRIRRGFFDLFDINSNSSTEASTTPASEPDGDLDPYRRDSSEDTGIDDLHEDLYTTESIDPEDPYTEREDEENGNLFGSGDRIDNTVPQTPAKEVTMRVSFVLGEPYQQESNQKDSNLFQQLSLALADAVNALYDPIPGDQRATLVRIQSRPADELTCKVTLDLTTVDYYNLKHIESTLRDHIRRTRRLASYTVSDDEFSFELFDGKQILDTGVEQERCGFRCQNGECAHAEAKCDGNYDCADKSDEHDCDINSACVEDELVCDVTRCVPKTKQCDGIADCNDGTDERDCPGRCQPDEFRCNDGECIDGHKKCDTVMDCRDFEDESGCPCTADEFTCLNGKCIEHRKVCDGRDNCGDGSDEIKCAEQSVHNVSWSGMHVCNVRGQFRCDDGTCLSVLLRCDGVVNCPKDGADEVGCPCTSDQWQCDFGTCINSRRRCDGHVDCPTDRSDERHCDATTFKCIDGTLISASLKCNRNYDCPPGDYSDERDCPCGKDDFQCNNGHCIPASRHCDGTNDCQDRSDEQNCPAPGACMHNEFKCKSGGCIEKLLRCDGQADCDDNSDEEHCPCSRDEFHCHNATCINISLRCNGNKDCLSGEDELNCGKCRNSEWRCWDGTCIDLFLQCNGESDCLDNSDEFNCITPITPIPLLITCGPDSFRCNNGQCIDIRNKCDGVRHCPGNEDENNCSTGECPGFLCGDGTCLEAEKECDYVDDCADGSDEQNCNECQNSEFRCDNGECINEGDHCDGKNDCVDGSDERGCSNNTIADACEIFCEGRCIHNEQICDGNKDCPDGQDERDCDSDQYCKDKYLCSDGTCLEFDIVCDGKPDCFNGEDESECRTPQEWPTRPPRSLEPLPVNPSYTIGICLESEFTCYNGMCIPHIRHCDNIYDCRDFSDEQNCYSSGCDQDKWKCRSGECIFENERCDGIPHCRDQSDEESPPCPPPTRPPPVFSGPVTFRPLVVPPTTFTTAPPTGPPYTPFTDSYPTAPRLQCLPNEWRCENGPCISLQLRCNGRVDCRYDSSDELDCPSAGKLDLRTYPNDQVIRQSGDVVFLCRDEGPIRAPVRWHRANGLPLPPNSTDVDGRLEMPNIQLSHSGVYICRADGYLRSTPGSELSVMLTVEPFEHTSSHIGFPRCELHEATCSNGDCIPKSSVCDGNYDCSDGSDEEECQSHGCEPNEFLCSNRRCILKTWLCDSDDDCRDGSDEAHCSPQLPGDACRPNEFQCSSSQCVPRGFHCDGERDCIDGSDEVGCSPVYISQPPKPLLILSQHETMVITCIAIGVPTPEVVWRRNWGHVPEKCSYTSVNGLGTLTCPDIQPEDQGAYSCEALNNKGSVFAVPDTMLLVNGSVAKVCPDGYFNSEAQSPQECISCFCFGATTKCKSADLFTYQLPTPLGQGGTRLVGVVQPPGEPLQITDEPISDSFVFSPSYNGVTITPIGPWGQTNIHPYISLPENYQGSQLTSYGGFIKYSVEPNGGFAIGSQSPLPDIIIKGGGNTLIHYSRSRNTGDNNISVQLFPEYWQKVTPYGQQSASREDIMMALANVEVILLRGEGNGNGVVISNFKMDSAQSVNTGQGTAAFVEECECPNAYRGLSCHNCNIGYTRVASGSWLGQCVREQQKCELGYYGDPSNGIPCQKCPCPLSNPENQFASTCHLDRTGQVICDCISGYEGRRCEKCAPGYVGNPTIPGDYCRPGPPPSTCDPRGTDVEENGYCKCKLYAEGEKCDRCREDAFHLSADNENGCSNCFCMGVTTSCGVSSLRRRTSSLQFVSNITSHNIEIMELPAGSQTRHLTPVQVDLETDVQNRELLLRRFPPTNPGTYYWSMPKSFTGDKVTAYGGMLTYSLRHIPAPGGQSSRNNAPDVQLHSVDNEILLYHYSGAMPNYNGFLNSSVQLIEKYWQRADGNPATREYMLQALADLSSLLIKATYTTSTYEAGLISVSLETADEAGNGPRALHVEQCKCPPGYLGTSCEDCAPGYTRSEEGIYLGFCEQCKCNGHSDQCHPETGECFNCQHNTYGESCEECLPGYILDENRVCSSSNISSDCRCDPRGSVGPCRFGVCQCKSNVEGDRCQQCRYGTFHLQEENPRGCKNCYCSGVSNQCHEATYWYRQQIPIAIIDDNHDFTLTTLNKDRVISNDFKLNLQFNQIGYVFDPYVNRDRYFWTLPTFNGNKVLSYGGHVSITQKYETSGYERESTDDIDVVLIGKTSTIYWINPRKLQPSVALSYSVPLVESEWKVLGESPSVPVTRAEFMSVLADLESVLVRATLSPYISETYIADLSMDTALEENTGQSPALDVELCSCPKEYTGTSCERCATGYYKDRSNRCVVCNCNGRAQSCSLGPNDNVICDCVPPYQGPDCSIVDGEGGGGNVGPPPLRPSIRVTVSAPTIQIKAVGSTVRFKCAAHSRFYPSTPLNVTWSREGGSLPRGRSVADASGELVIMNVKESDSGTYICRATDGIQSGEDRATLTVPGNEATAPQIVLEPPYVDVYEGDPIELRCLAQGNPLPTLAWVRVGAIQPLREFSNQFSSGIFRIESAKLSDQGDYKCIASNAAGSVDMTAVVYVRPREAVEPVPNQFVIQPSSPNLVEGDSSRIVCSAPNVPPNNIIWTRVNGYLPDNFVSTNGLLLITNGNQENSGTYECSAPNAGKPVQPTTVVITVHPSYPNLIDDNEEAPSVTVDYTNLTIPEGETHTINCQPQGNPLPIVKWIKIGSEFGPSVSQRGNSLIISQARQSDRGRYVCKALSHKKETVAQASTAVEIERREMPAVEIWPEGIQVVRLGGNAQLMCRIAAGIPEPLITWSRPNGRQLSSNTHLLPGGILSFTDISVNEEGEYICTASNLAGIGSATASLSVQSPPSIVIKPDEYITVNEGEPINVECRISGHPEPQAHWLKIHPDNRVLGPDTYNVAHLNIQRARPDDDGTYVCVAHNSAGSTEVQVKIVVDVDTDPPRGDIPTNENEDESNDIDYDQRPDTFTAIEGQPFPISCRTRQGVETEWVRSDGRPLPYNSVQSYNILNLANVTHDDEGIYECRGRDMRSGAIVFIARTRLAVVTAPKIILRPKIQTVRPGDTAYMRCDVTGSKPMHIEWLPTKGGTIPISDRVFIQGGILTFRAIEVEDAGQYVCKANNTAGEAEAFAEVIVNEGISSPESSASDHKQLAYTGSVVQLSCNVTDVDAIVTWSKDNGTLPSKARELGGVLQFKRIDMSDAGRYICRVQDVAGRITQDYIDLVIEGNLCDQVENFQCNDRSGCISAELVCDEYPDCDDSSDEYDCPNRQKRLSNLKAGLNSTSIDNQRPIGGSVVIDSPQQPVLAGDNIRIHCRANSDRINVSWRKFGSNQQLNSRNYAGGSLLDLPNVQQTDEGVYRCEGTDDYGGLFDDEFTLYVQPVMQQPIPERVQREEDIIETAPLGSTIDLPCSTNLNGPVKITWQREKGSLPSAIDSSNPTLRLTSITERDAGPYICKAWNGQTEIVRRIILQITNVIPQFSGDSYMALDTLKDAFLRFDIEISIKPMDHNGVVLYNSLEYEPVEPDDMVSLTLVDGVPEFKFDFGAGPATVRGDTPLELGKWHTIKIHRNEEKGFMYIDGNNKVFSGVAPGTRTGLDLKTPLYIGGVPDYNMLPPQFINRTGFIGCVSRLVLNKEEISIMRQAIQKHNIEECDSCQPNPCHNGGVCQNALNEKGVMCICRPGFAGYDCSRMGAGCIPDICGVGHCLDTENGFKCSCPLGYLGERCETQQKIEYPAFGGGAFMAYQPPKSANLKMYLKVKPVSPIKDGIIMYWAESRHGYGGFTSLAVNRGYVEFRFDTGSGPEVLRSIEPLKANEWTEISISRMLNEIKLTINQEKPLVGKIPDKGKALKFVTSMYIGGYDEEFITLNNRTEVSGGFNGCIKDVKVFSKLLDIHSPIIHSFNIHECGSNNDDRNRGDIPLEANTSAEESSVCQQCENDGYCPNAYADSCTCPPGYSGRYCETSLDKACDSQPCYGGGTCRPTSDGLYKCDCPLGYGGYHCQTRIELRENVHLRGDGYVELPSHLLPHNRPNVPETIALAISTEQEDGALFYQREKRAVNFHEGNYILLQISRGYVELKWELGSGEGYVASQIFVADGQRHSIIVKRTGSEADLTVDGYEESSRAPGLTQTMNADSNLYIGGIPASINSDEISGFIGCIQQIELQDSKAIDIGRTAVSAVNASPCANTQTGFLNGGN